eukprot:7312580-Pyramimonas_sp.AAC.1
MNLLNDNNKLVIKAKDRVRICSLAPKVSLAQLALLVRLPVGHARIVRLLRDAKSAKSAKS